MKRIKTILSYFPRIYRFRILRYEFKTELTENFEGMDVRLITLENVDHIDWWDKEKIYAYRSLIEKGNIGIYVYCDGKPVAQAFGFIKELPKLKKISKHLAVKDRSAIIGNGGIHENYQGRKIYNLLMSKMRDKLLEMGYEHIYGDITVENIAPQKACEKAGFIHIENNLRFGIRSRTLFNIVCKKDNILFK